MTAIALEIMIIATTSAAANDIGTTTYETYDKEQQLSKEDTVNRIKASTTNNHKTRHKRRTQHTLNRDKDEETRHHEGAETNLRHSPTNGKLQAGEGTLPESTANTQNGNNEPSSGTGKNTRNKVTSINHTQETTNTPIKNTSPRRRNAAERTPNNTMVSGSGLLEDIRKTGRRRKKQRIPQQAGRKAEAKELIPGH
jgi:hypothetical protein